MDSLVEMLTARFLAETPFYFGKVSTLEVARAYSCSVKSMGFEHEDGWNPEEYKLIMDEFKGQEVRRNGQVIMWITLAGEFHSWLTSQFENL